MENKKIIFLCGAVDRYEEFDRYDDALRAMGYNTLLPTHLPGGLTKEQEMQICMAMINCADAVLALSDWDKDMCASFEINYCSLINKPFILPPKGPEVKPYWLREALEEVFKV